MTKNVSFYSINVDCRISELERQVNDRISFQKFLGFPEIIPDPFHDLSPAKTWKYGKNCNKLDSKGLKMKNVLYKATTATCPL
jgi:hypothetical protein